MPDEPTTTPPVAVEVTTPAPPAEPVQKASESPTQDDVAKLQQAIAKERELRKEAEKKARDGQSAADKLAEIEKANQSELERAVAKAREEGASESTAKANVRLRNAEARALAAEAKFRNPTLAVKALDLSDVTVAEDGTVDSAAIRTLLDELAKADPYLVDDGRPTRPRPDDAQGRVPAAAASTATPGLGRLRQGYAEISKAT